MTGVVQEAISERLEGERPNRLRALGAAIVVGIGAALLTYRLLRNDASADDEGERDGD